MRGSHEQALEMLDKAHDLEPNNAQSRFQRANVLIAMERHEVCSLCSARRRTHHDAVALLYFVVVVVVVVVIVFAHILVLALGAVLVMVYYHFSCM